MVDVVKVVDIQEGKKRTPRGRVKWDWDAIFARYMEMGPGRTYARLSEEFGPTVRTISTSARRLKWAEKMLELQSEAQKRAEESMTRTMSERITNRIMAIDIASHDFLERVIAGEVQLTADQFVKMLDRELQLAGVPQRLEVQGEITGPQPRSEERLLGLLNAAREAGLLPKELNSGD